MLRNQELLTSINTHTFYQSLRLKLNLSDFQFLQILGRINNIQILKEKLKKELSKGGLSNENVAVINKLAFPYPKLIYLIKKSFEEEGTKIELNDLKQKVEPLLKHHGFFLKKQIDMKLQFIGLKTPKAFEKKITAYIKNAFQISKRDNLVSLDEREEKNIGIDSIFICSKKQFLNRISKDPLHTLIYLDFVKNKIEIFSGNYSIKRGNLTIIEFRRFVLYSVIHHLLKLFFIAYKTLFPYEVNYSFYNLNTNALFRLYREYSDRLKFFPATLFLRLSESVGNKFIADYVDSFFQDLEPTHQMIFLKYFKDLDINFVQDADPDKNSFQYKKGKITNDLDVIFHFLENFYFYESKIGLNRSISY